MTGSGPTGARVRLLGPPQASDADGTPVRFRSRKVLALLAFLAVEGPDPHRRDGLLGLLWPEAAPDAARNSLRVALADLRRVLGDGAAALAADRASVRLTPPDGGGWLDVAGFTGLLEECRGHRQPDEPCPDCAARLERAVELYRGEFLAGLWLPDAAPFEEWALVRRQGLHQQAVDALAGLAAAAERDGDYPGLCRHAGRQLELEAWHEPAHRQLMRGRALLGQRDAALAQYQRCRQVLAEELGVEPEVETRALYERIRTGGFTAATRDPAAPRHNLPAPLTPFVGREDTLRVLAGVLRRGEVRLLTLAGAGGMGKTRLALELARASLDAFPDGVHLVALAPVAEASAIVDAVAAAIGLSVHGGDPTAGLLRFLRDRRLLLILDNFEHLPGGAGLVADILAAAPGTRILATSRQPLNLQTEQVYLVEGLDYADDPGAAAGSAARLFSQAARRASAGFRLDQANRPGVLRICRLVAGMPLALELAAAWVETLPVPQIAAEIAGSPDVLAAEWPDEPERHHSIRAVFAWSWNLLTGPQRAALRRLSVFHGGFTREAADAVAAAGLPALAGLVHRSLLRRTDLGTSRPARYEIHELLRHFAAEQLGAEPAEQAEVHAAHSRYYLAFLAGREAHLIGGATRQAIAEIRAELDNIRQAWAWAATHRQVADLHAGAHPLGQFYVLTGLLSEAGQVFGQAAERLTDTTQPGADTGEQAAGAHPSGDAGGQPAGERPPGGQPAGGSGQQLLGTLWAFQAMALGLQGDYTTALPLAQRAAALGQTNGAVAAEVTGQMVWGEILARTGDHRQARPLFERALARARDAVPGQPQPAVLMDAEWRAELWLGWIALLHDEYPQAGGHVEEALRTCRARGAQFGEMTCRYRRGIIAATIGDHPAARDDQEQALRLAQTLGYLWGQAVAQRRLGDLLPAFGEHARASDLLHRALDTFRAIGDHTSEAGTLASLGHLHDGVADYTRAADRLGQALQASLAVHADEPTLDGLLHLAMLSQHLGQPEAALAHVEHARGIAVRMGSRSRQAQVLFARGRALEGLRRRPDARAAYQEALALHHGLATKASLTVQPHTGLARIALAEGDHPRALQHAEGLFSLLTDHPWAGVEDHHAAYHACYQVLHTHHDPRALTVARAAHTLLYTYADTIPDEQTRRSFLHAVPTHRELIDAATSDPDPAVGHTA